MTEAYTFPNLPLEPIETGRTVLVYGPSRAASRLARRLTLELGDEEGAIFISANAGGTSVVRETAGTYPELDLHRLGIVDATGRSDIDIETDARLQAVSGTGDLTGISIKFSILFSALADDGIDRIRSCIDSLSLLVLYKELRTVVRFTHSIAGRIRATGGFGCFVLDPEMHEPQVKYTLKSVCDGAIEVREHGGGYQIQTEGLAGQPGEWQDVNLSP